MENEINLPLIAFGLGLLFVVGVLLGLGIVVLNLSMSRNKSSTR